MRLEVADTMSDEMLDLLVRELELHENDVYRARGLVDLRCLWQLHAPPDRPDLKDRPAARGAGPDRQGHRDRATDRVGHARPGDHGAPPVRSFTTSIEAFIEQAAVDPRVQSIKMTLYRAGGDSPIMRALIRAAERGVQVAVLVELKARFDEANVNRAKQPRARRRPRRLRDGRPEDALGARARRPRRRRPAPPLLPHRHRQLQLEDVKRIYEDLGILTCDIDVGADVAKLFNHLTGYSRDDTYHTPAAAAPRDLRPRCWRLPSNTR